MKKTWDQYREYLFNKRVYGEGYDPNKPRFLQELKVIGKAFIPVYGDMITLEKAQINHDLHPDAEWIPKAIAWTFIAYKNLLYLGAAVSLLNK